MYVEVGWRGVTHRILEAGPQVLHGIVELPLLAQGPKDKALDVLRRVDSEGTGRRRDKEKVSGAGK